MRFLILSVFVIIIVFSFFQTDNSSLAEVKAKNQDVQLNIESFDARGITAKAYSVFDVKTGNIIFSRNSEEVLPIASITKLFTAAEAMRDRESEFLTIIEADVATEGRAGKLEVNQTYRVHDLIFPLLIESSNDAAAALGRKVGSISIASHTLSDTTGLSFKNKASALELSQEIRRLYISYPHIFDITKLKQYIGEYTGWINNSPVYDLPGYMGGKHGYTVEAKKTLAAIFTEQSLGDREIGYIILGSDNVREDVMRLREIVKNSVHTE